MKILVTGGHVTPAIALIDRLKDKYKIVFVGRKYPLDREKTISLEYKEVTAREIRFINLKAGRFTRVLSPQTVLSILKVPLGFFHAAKILQSEKPDLVFSFGGYIALPIVIWAAVFKIPIYTHEQTINPGAANRLIGKYAKKVFVAFEEAADHFDKKKVVFSGNPVRKEVLEVKDKPFDLEKNRPVIYVTGGSLGSHSVNVHIKKILHKLLEKYIVIHQVGDTQEFNDFSSLLGYKESLPQDLSDRYFIKTHFSGSELGYIYQLSDLVVGRSGANTFFELVSLDKPAVFIPLPWSAGAEQQKQAKIFKEAGCGEIFMQSDKSENLHVVVKTLLDNIDSYKKNFKNLKKYKSRDAIQIILKEVFA